MINQFLDDIESIMPQIHRSALVPYTTEQMYHLVNDVLSYPQFLPDCVGSQLISHSEEQLIARVDVAKLGIRKSFSTHNKMIKNRYIHLQLVDGPFKRLEGEWHFTPIDSGSCKIEFKLDFEFKNKLIGLAFGPIFSEMANSMVQAFTQRAQKIYGESK